MSDGADVDADPLRERLRSSEFHSTRGFSIHEAEAGRVVLGMPIREAQTNFGGALHGGALASLIDTASAIAIRTTFEDPTEPQLATTDLSVSYVRPARSDVRAEARVVRVGGSLAVVEVEVTGVAPDGERKIVATGRTTYRILVDGSD